MNVLLSAAQKRAIYIVMTTASGPAINIVCRQFHVAPDLASMWLDLMSAVTLAIGLGWGLAATGNAGLSTAMSELPPDDKRSVVNQMPHEAKAELVNAMPTDLKVESLAQESSVTKVVIQDNVGGHLGQMALDDQQPKVVTVSEDNNKA